MLVTSTGADYVFEPGYRLQPLSEVASYIQANHHLPDIPSAGEVKQKGIGVGEMESKLLAKIEKLTLHMIQADQRNNRLEQQNQELRDQICSLQYSGGVLGLWSDNASQLYTTPPLRNTQCSIGNYTVNSAGNTLTFTVSITFQTPFEGSQELYALGKSSSGDYHPWVDLGAWTVTAPTTQRGSPVLPAHTPGPRPPASLPYRRSAGARAETADAPRRIPMPAGRRRWGLREAELARCVPD